MHVDGGSVIDMERPTPRDRGSVLVMVLIMIVIGGMIVVPTLSYAVAVTRHNTALSDKTARLEAIKGGLRIALADPQSLYEVCGSGTTLASTTISGIQVDTTCQFLDFQVAQGADQLRTGLTSTGAGTTVPDPLQGDAFVPADPASTTEWQDHVSTVSTTGQIWMPLLPVHGLDRRPAAGSPMPAGYPDCTIYFPGTYVDPIVIDGPTYFTSGIYSFENEVRVVGGADIVAGMGAASGCATDQEAAFYAENAPSTHNINGLGATWIFGAAGRLVVDNTSGPVRLEFNARYVAPGDAGTAPSADVSIMSVNGSIDPASVDGAADRSQLVMVPLSVPGVIDVPASSVTADPDPVAANLQDYLPSTLVPTAADPATPPTTVTPVVEFATTGASPVTIRVPGYVAVPQGRFVVDNPNGLDIRVTGGLLAASIEITDGRANGPQTVPIGFVESVVQRKFRIVSSTSAGPERSTAIVQVNQNGAYAVNSWEVQ